MPPLESTCSVAGAVVTLNTSDIVCGAVSEAVVNTCCAAAPVSAVPFSVNCSVFVVGSEAPNSGDAVPEYVAKYVPGSEMVISCEPAVCAIAVPLIVPF